MIEDQRHRRQLGGTAVLWRALRAGEIDVYPEYTGTLAAELLRGVDARDLAGMRRALAREGVAMSAPLGFNNTYALGVPEPLAAARGLRTLGDLAETRRSLPETPGARNPLRDEAELIWNATPGSWRAALPPLGARPRLDDNSPLGAA